MVAIHDILCLVQQDDLKEELQKPCVQRVESLAKPASYSEFCPTICATTRVRNIVDCGATLLLKAILLVILLLLVIAGDVEINPGPEGNLEKA